MTDYFFGEVPGHPPGTAYASRREAANAGVHQVLMQGISGNRYVGANSIAISGGYADDKDHGSWILYTGSGGRDSASGQQIANQELSSNDNAALVFSEENALPLRVLRGTNGDPAFSPETGYRYDGLFKASRHWMDVGAHGFKVWRFRLDALSPDESAPWRPDSSSTNESVAAGVLPGGDEAPARREGVVQRIVRNTRVSEGVKSAYQHECQICQVRLDMPVGRYAEGAHIRGLGEPHNGPDQRGNVLCLCPNHHVLLDKGGIYIDDDLVVCDFTGKEIGPLVRAPGHMIELDHIRYHRATFGFESIVVGAVIVDDLASPRQVLATRRNAGSAGAGKWEFPGGKVELGEAAEAAVLREALEELGVTLRLGSEITADAAWPIPPESRLRLFLAEVERGAPRVGKSHDDLRWVGPSEFLELDWLPADRLALEAIASEIGPAD